MQTVLAFENDIKCQLEFLDTFKPQKTINPKNLMFCGSGDSLVSCMMAECFSNYQSRAIDPLDLIKNKDLSKNKHVYFVSISGRTISNIKAAKMVKKSTSITKNPASNLSRACAGLIQLDYDDSHVLTSGSVSFLASMLTCISLVSCFRVKNAKKLFLSAKSQARKISLRNKVYFVGSQYTYPLCMYAAAKLHEVLGMDARYERIEQFSHAGVFSAKPGDTIILFEGKNRHNERFTLQMKKLGMSVHNPSIKSCDKISQAIFYTFVSQILALNVAKRKHLADCYFITEKKIRNVSSSMIY